MGRGEHASTTALIAASRAILAEEQPTTVRRVVYALFNQKHITGTDKTAENLVSRLLTIGRNDGRIPWEWIVDEHRRMERTLTFRDPGQAFRAIQQHYRKDYWPEQPMKVIVWSEKSTVAGILAPTLREYEVPFLAVHGNNSTTRVHEVVEDQHHDGRPWVILYIGDWDPSGCYMSEVDLPQRLEQYSSDIKIKRIALIESDLAPLRANSFHVDAKRLAAIQQHGDKVGKKGLDNNRAWFVAHHGETCMELDAMSSVTLRTRVETAIQGYIDQASWQQMKLCERAEMDTVDEFCGRFKRGA